MALKASSCEAMFVDGGLSGGKKACPGGTGDGERLRGIPRPLGERVWLATSTVKPLAAAWERVTGEVFSSAGVTR